MGRQRTPGFAAENLRKPPETAAISGRIKPMAAEEVAEALVRGIERDQRDVTMDNATRTFLRLGGVLDPAVRWSFRRTVKRVTKCGCRGPSVTAKGTSSGFHGARNPKLAPLVSDAPIR